MAKQVEGNSVTLNLILQNSLPELGHPVGSNVKLGQGQPLPSTCYATVMSDAVARPHILMAVYITTVPRP